MSLRKVASGEPFRPRAEDWNAFVDAARDFQARRHGIGAGAMAQGARPGMILARNCSGSAQPQFAALGLQELTLQPDDTDAEQRFRTGPHVFDVGPVAGAMHEFRFAILQEPLAAGALGRALVCGVTPARLSVVSEAHDHAAPSTVEPSALVSSFHGPCRILWKQPGTGTVWALVEFPVSDGTRVMIENTSGELLQDGSACMVDGCGSAPWTMRVTKPTGDSRLQTLAYSGPALAPGATGFARQAEVMRFRVDVADLQPGEFIGTRAGSWMLTRNRFGFLVLAAETIGGASFAYARYSGLPPVLQAATDEDPVAHTIDVRHVDSDGAPLGDAFTLDVIPES